jgi:uncharacterized membrane protein
MLLKNAWPHINTWLRISAGTCLTLIFILWILPGTASAHTTVASAAGLSMRVDMGFNSRYRDGSWVPIQVMLRNEGPDFNGTVSINLPTPYAGINNAATTASTYQQAVSLSTGAQKQLVIDAPIFFGAQGSTQTVDVNLLDNTGKKVLTQTGTLRSLGLNDILVGVLSDQSAGLPSLGQVTQPNQAATVYEEQLNSTNMPRIAKILTNFDVIILDNFTTSALNQDQIQALQNWVAQGGTLVEVGGPQWRGTLTPLPASLLPVNIAGTSTLPAGTNLLPVGGPSNSGPGQNAASGKLPSALTISDATAPANSTVLLSSGQTPLIVQASYEQGNVYYLAFDPTLTPLTNWSSTPDIWKGILIRTLGDRFLDASQNPNSYGTNNIDGSWETLLQSLFPNAFPTTWLILALLIGYVVILGPVRLLIIYFTKKRTWSWRIVLATIALFSLLSYGLAIQQKGTSIISSNISVIKLDRPGTPSTNAHVTTFTGVFVPSQGNFQVNIAGNDLVQPIDDNSSRQVQFNGTAPSGSGQTTVTEGQNNTNVTLQGVNIWTMRSLATQRDTQIKGGIFSHLTVQDGQLIGIVTNGLPYGLSDSYLLIGDQYVSLGNLTAGQTKSIKLSINISPNNQQSLADQIAASHGLPTPYMPPYAYSSSEAQTQNNFQRHMAMLSTVSGELSSFYCNGGGPCYQPITFVNGNKQLFYGGKGLQTGGQDPLLLSDADATFIGWADNQPGLSSKVSINGLPPSGIQESLIQAPLDVNYAGALNKSSSLVAGQLVDVQSQGSNIQSQYPGIYTLTTGTMTFEFTLPYGRRLHVNSLTISENPNVANGLTNGGAAGPVGDLSHIQTFLYNWHTGDWDAVSFNQSTLSINKAQNYTNDQGRVLLQIANQDSSQAQIIVTRPVLQIQGSVLP